jgi:hypothetical protein
MEQLRSKYAEMLAMRLEDASRAPSGDEYAARVRANMSDLAARFPGALRELDHLELSEIRLRIDKLDGVLGGAREPEPWMHAVALFHGLARGALWAKRWLKGRRIVSQAVQAAYEADARTLELGFDALEWAAELAEIARPPQGRVMDLVYARVARELGVTEAQARRTVFGPAPKRTNLGCSDGG